MLASLLALAALVVGQEPVLASTSCDDFETLCEGSGGSYIEGPNLSCGNGWKEAGCLMPGYPAWPQACCDATSGGCADGEPPTEQCGTYCNPSGGCG
jgi:hypothetical protein